MTTTLDKPEAQNVQFELEAHGVSFKLTITPVANNSPTEPTSEQEFPPSRLQRISDPIAASAGIGVFRDLVPSSTPELYASVKKRDPAPILLPSASQQKKIQKILDKRVETPVQLKPAKRKTKKKVKRTARKKQ